ncbi:hypothetical protein BJN34_28305 [Cupriavidus necator]|uniref:Uncharacterized protein n=1 Tax=Cupriavidus necator TaxID=106590 RepID=A0A1U9UYQ3_CUPNE|nr:hypothetical protein [Cupriavidus necator]AQV97773.1 hypothetical protein BJN34_28305 [Cupriavidus necator]
MRYCFSRSLVARQSIRRRLAHALLVALFVCGLSWVSEADAACYWVNTSGNFSTPEDACTAFAVQNGNKFYQVTTNANGTKQCWMEYTSAPGTYWQGLMGQNLNCTAGAYCPGAGTMNKYIGASVQGTSTSIPSTICIQGCAYNVGSVGVQVGTSYATDLGKGTGATCTGANYDVLDTTTQKTDPPSLISCSKKGMVYGTVNGVGICAAAGTIPNSTVTTSGSTTTQATSASGVQAPPQTTGDTTTVSNVNGVPSVTKTVTNPDGSKSSTTEDQTGYCAKNPNDQVCKKSESTASGGADCGAAPTCSGDAIQCMMVNQQWHTRCDSNQPNSLSDLGSKLVNGQDPVSNPADSANRVVKPVGSSIDQTAFLGGSGLSDKLVTVSGQTITLPFSKLNQYLVWIGHLFVVLSLIGAVRIVIGGFK